MADITEREIIPHLAGWERAGDVPRGGGQRVRQ